MTRLATFFGRTSVTDPRGGEHLHSLTAEGGTQDGVLRPLRSAEPCLAEAFQSPEKNFHFVRVFEPGKTHWMRATPKA